jgi:hypothetical protein
MENIWYDSEVYNGRGTKWLDEDNKAPIYNTTEIHLGPENKRECPCDTCPMMQQCLENATECSAMRNWCARGDYADKDLMRLVRGVA